MKKGNLYKITNIETNNIYIGCTKNTLKNRFNEHCYRCLKKDTNSKLCNNIRKYGIEKFQIELLEQCPLENLYQREIELIQEYDTYNNGLNSTLGGEGNLGCYHSIEVRNKISDILKNGKSHKGKTYEEIYNNFDEQKENRRQSVKRHWDSLSEEEKQKRVAKMKLSFREKSKYSIETVNEVKKLLKENVKPKEINKLYPEMHISMIYSIKYGKRWKD